MCPPPRVSAHSQQVHMCPLHPLPGQLQRLLLGGLTHHLLPGFLSHPVSGLIGKACPSETDSVSRQQGCFPGSHSPPARPLPLRPQRPPRAPRPLALPGPSLPSGLALPFHSPCRVSGSSHHPGQAVCCPGEAPCCQVGPPTQHSGQHPPPALFPLHGPRAGSGPTVCPGSHLIPALPTGKLLCAC